MTGMSNKNRFKDPSKEKGKKVSLPQDTKETPPEQLPPIFSLCHLDGDYCLTKCEKDDQAAFALKIHKLSKLTWSQIQSEHRHKLGYEKIPRHSLKASIPRFITEDVNLIAFRFSGKKPMVGYREKTIFYVIWLDRNFTLYDHG